MEQFLIVCPLVFLAGFVDSIAGGGGLISLPAYFIAGLNPHMALGTNKLSSTMGTAISAVRFAKKGYIRGRLAVCCAVLAIAGSSIGSNLSLLVSGVLIKNLMIFILPVVAYYVLKSKDMGENEKTGTLPEKKTFLIACLAAFAVGAYDGFYGPGTGTFLILILTGPAKMGIKEASGITKAINLSSNVSALCIFLINGQVLYPLGLAAGLFCVAGNYVGSGLVVKNGQRIVRPVVLVVLCILFIQIIKENFPAIMQILI